MDQHIENSKPVLIHCNGGHGRTGVLVTAYMMKSEKMSVEAALKKVLKLCKRIPHKDGQYEVFKKYKGYLKDQNITT